MKTLAFTLVISTLLGSAITHADDAKWLRDDVAAKKHGISEFNEMNELNNVRHELSNKYPDTWSMLNDAKRIIADDDKLTPYKGDARDRELFVNGLMFAALAERNKNTLSSILSRDKIVATYKFAKAHVGDDSQLSMKGTGLALREYAKLVNEGKGSGDLTMKDSLQVAFKVVWEKMSKKESEQTYKDIRSSNPDFFSAQHANPATMASTPAAAASQK